MRSWGMTEPGDGILAGVSGGADSVCLLVLLDELKEELGIRLAAFHLNHGLRGAEADRDEAYVREICGRLGVPLAAAHENVAEYAAARGISGEEAGRILRKRCFSTCSGGAALRAFPASVRCGKISSGPFYACPERRSPGIWRRRGFPGARIPPTGKMCIQETGSGTA